MNVDASLACDENIKKLDHNEIFQWACIQGHLDIVVQMLLCGFDPAEQNNKAIRNASVYGHLTIVDRLLQDVRVDPSAMENAAVINASHKGYVDVVDRLLQDPRVNPADRGNTAIVGACYNKHMDVVVRLIKDARVNSIEVINKALVNASTVGNCDLVDLLLLKNNGDLVDGHRALWQACYYGHLYVADRLLKDPRITPTYACVCACIYGACGQIVAERLLQDPRCHIRADDEPMLNSLRYAIQTACDESCCQSSGRHVLKLLLRQGMWFETHTHTPYSRYTHEYKNARMKWYAERAEQFGELHTELVASVIHAMGVI